MVRIFKPGDRVRSTKGGPVLEVKGYDEQARVICSWYEARRGWRKRAFREEALHRVRRSRTPNG